MNFTSARLTLAPSHQIAECADAKFETRHNPRRAASEFAQPEPFLLRRREVGERQRRSLRGSRNTVAHARSCALDDE